VGALLGVGIKVNYLFTWVKGDWKNAMKNILVRNLPHSTARGQDDEEDAEAPAGIRFHRIDRDELSF
jgi:hypothetical protein